MGFAVPGPVVGTPYFVPAARNVGAIGKTRSRRPQPPRTRRRMRTFLLAAAGQTGRLASPARGR